MFYNNHDNLYVVKIEDTPTKSGWFSGSSLFRNDSSDNEFEKFIRDGHKYYVLPHNKEYAVRMINKSHSRVNAVLKIDGEIMGKWRINQYSDILIERPSHKNRKFTFVRENSWQAGMAGVNRGDYQNGLIEVTFIPEIHSDPYRRHVYESDDYDRSSIGNISRLSMKNMNDDSSRQSNFLDSAVPQSSMRENSESRSASFNSTNSYSTGATVLGNNSSQTFFRADYMVEDRAKSVTKRVRLVVSENENRKPFVSIRNDVYDYNDPVPPPIRNANQFRQYDRTFASRFDPNENRSRSKIDVPSYFNDNYERRDSEYQPHNERRDSEYQPRNDRSNEYFPPSAQ
jgi:hypothetical protein